MAILRTLLDRIMALERRVAALIAAGAGAHNVLSATHPDCLPAGIIRGSLIVGNATPKWARLLIGGANQVLTSNGTDAAWAAPAAPAAHDILAAAHGDTLAAAVSQGSLIVGNATPKWAELVIGAADQVLTSDGTDATWAAAQAWEPLTNGDPVTPELIFAAGDCVMVPM